LCFPTRFQFHFLNIRIVDVDNFRLFEIISVNIDRMHLYCRSGNSCSSAHLPSNSSSSLLLDYTVSAATFICGLASPKMTSEPSVTVHVLGFCFCTFPAPRDMQLRILVFVLRVHLPYPWLLLPAGVLCYFPYHLLCVVA